MASPTQGRDTGARSGNAVDAPPSRSGTKAAYWVPVLIVILTAAVFGSVRDAGFTNWRDDENLRNHSNYQGLGGAQLLWMFTSTEPGHHYQPLTWLSYALDYVSSGMNPGRFHATNLSLHVLASLLFYAVMAQLLSMRGRAAPPQERPGEFRACCCAGLAALLFAIHPLRAECVGWISARGHVLGAVFLLATILFYVKSVPQRGPGPGGATDSSSSVRSASQRRWLILSVVAFALSLLSRADAVFLPPVLLVMDVYVLRRLGGDGGLFGPGARRLWAEKIPFAVVALTALVGVLWGDYSDAGTPQPADPPVMDRLAALVYGLVFYVHKTVLPIVLSPYYERPAGLAWHHSSYLVSGVAVVPATLILRPLRRRLPAVWAAWCWYAIILFPSVWWLQSHQQLASDRYSYLSCLPFAALAGALMSKIWRSWSAGGLPGPVFAPICGMVLIGLGGLGWLAGQRARVWKGPVTVWVDALKRDPGCILAKNRLGLAFIEKKDFESAATLFGQVLESVPDNVEALSNPGSLYFKMNRVEALRNLGSLYFKVDRFGQAVEHLQHAVDLDPDNAENHILLARALLKQREPDEAILHLAQAVQLNPIHPDAHAELGEVLEMQGHYEEAAELFRQDLKINPAKPLSRFYLGLCLSKLGQLAGASEQYRLAIQGDPEFVQARYNLGVARMHLGRTDEAIDEFRELLDMIPGLESILNKDLLTAQTHKGLADALIARGSFDEALQHANEAIRLAPGLAGVHVTLGEVALAQGRREEALKHYRAALRQDPENQVAKAHLETLRRDGVGGEAAVRPRMPGTPGEPAEQVVARLEQRLHREPDNAEIRYELATVLAAMDHLDEARRRLEECLEIDPQHAAAHTFLAGLLSARGQPDQAERHYRLAIRYKPTGEEAHWRLGVFLRRDGRYAAAIDAVRAGLAQVPDNPPLLQELAWLLAASPDPDLRDGPEAVKCALKVRQVWQALGSPPQRGPRVLDVLAASYAEAGRFDDAVTTAQHAKELAERHGKTRLAAQIEKRLQLYRQRQTYRETDRQTARDPAQEDPA